MKINNLLSFGTMEEANVFLRRCNAEFALSNIDLRGHKERLLRCISMAMGCLDPESKNIDERLAWQRLLDAAEGREPRLHVQR